MEPNPEKDLLEQFRSVESTEPLLGHEEHLEDDGSGVFDFLEPFGSGGTQSQGGKGRLDDIAGAQMPPVILGEVIEGETSTKTESKEEIFQLFPHPLLSQLFGLCHAE